MNFINKVKSIKWWGWALGLVYFALQYGMYRFGNYLSEVFGTKANAWCPKIPAIDDMIHVVPIFVTIYVFSYVFWICAPAAVSLTKKSNLVNYIVGLSAAYIIGFLIFTFLPSYMDRTAEGLMNYTANGGDIFGRMLASVYAADGSNIAFNLFPSYHCMISAYCYLGVRKQPEISKGFQMYSLIMAILICMSTQLTKQHYILDMVGGLSIAIICYLVVQKINPGKRYE